MRRRCALLIFAFLAWIVAPVASASQSTDAVSRAATHTSVGSGARVERITGRKQAAKPSVASGDAASLCDDVFVPAAASHELERDLVAHASAPQQRRYTRARPRGPPMA